MLGFFKKLFMGNLSENGLKKEDVEVLFSQASFKKYIPVIAYDAEGGFYILEDNYVGFAFELSYFLYPSESVLKQLWSSIYADPLMPEGTVLQWIVYASPLVEPYIYEWLSKKKRREVIGPLEKYAEFLLRKTKEPFYKEWNAVLRRFHLFLFVKFPMDVSDLPSKKSEIATRKTNLKSSLELMGFGVRSLEPEELIFVYRAFLYPSYDHYQLSTTSYYDPEREIKDSVLDGSFYAGEVSPGVWKLTDRYLSVFSIRKGNRGYPKSIDPFHILSFFGSYRGEDALQLSCPFLVSFSLVKKGGRYKEVRRTEAEIYLKQKAFSALAVKFKERLEDSVSFVQRMEEGDEVFEGNYFFALLAPDLETLDTNSRILSEHLKKYGYTLQKEILAFTWFLTCLPFMVFPQDHFNRAYERNQAFLGESAALLTPVAIDSLGGSSFVVPLVSRKGQIFFYDLYESEGGYSGIVFGSTGAGKSFFVNHMIFNYFALGDTIIRIIDVGRSYQALVNLLGGYFIDFSPESGHCINVFWGHEDEESIKRDVPILTSLIIAMTYFYDVVVDQEATLYRNFVSDCILRAWERKGYELNLDDIYEEMVRRSQGTELENFVKYSLTDWVSSGPYGRLFNGPPSLDFSNPVIAFELSGTTSDERLMRVAVLAFASLAVLRDMYDPAKKGLKKIVVWDEFHRFLKSREVVEFAVRGVKEVRKENGSFVFATQNVADLLASPYKESLVNMLANIEYVFLLYMPSEEYSRIQSLKVLELSDFEVDFLRQTMRKASGKYSEGYLISRSRKIRMPFRLVVNPFLKWVYTTDPMEMMVRNYFIAYTNGNISKAIELCIEWEQKGKPIVHSEGRVLPDVEKVLV